MFDADMPTTQYLGSKQKLMPWIIDKFPKCNTILDAFSGSAAVSYNLKKTGKQIMSNDYLRSSYMFSKSLVENNTIKLNNDEIDFLLQHNNNSKNYIQKHFSDIFFTDMECKFLDNLHANILELNDTYKQSIAYSAAIRTCTQKMPGGKFRANLLKYRDKNFVHYRPKYARDIQSTFLEFVKQYNDAVFDNGLQNKAHNQHIFDLLDEKSNLDIDLVYFDPPYGGSSFNYQKDYFFLELFSKDYGKIKKFDGVAKTYELGLKNDFTAAKIRDSLQRMFELADHIPIWVISYNNRSIPKFSEFVNIIRKFKDVDSVYTKAYRYKTGNNEGLEEILFICK